MGRSSKRKKMEVTELLPKIPDELFIMEILAKCVDVKTLSTFACVSKWWNNTLHSQEFIDTHHRHHRQSMQPLFVDYEQKLLNAYQLRRRLRISTGNLPERVINMAEFSGYLGVDMIGQISLVCHDLVCVRYHHSSGSLLVCNPWTGQAVKLPPIPEMGISGPEYMTPVVFGYLASLGKYVIVGNTRLGRRVNKLSFDHVNDSSSEWKWETIKDECPRPVKKGVFVDNFVYWQIMDKMIPEKSNELSVSFDVEKEEFGVIKCPQTPYWESHPNLRNGYVTLLDLNGTLGLTDTITMSGIDKVFKLWALKRELGQWEMIYNVKLDHLGMPLSGRPFEVSPKSSMDGELILRSLHHRTWYIYNPKINGLRTIARRPRYKEWTYGRKEKVRTTYLIKSASFFVETWPPTKLY